MYCRHNESFGEIHHFESCESKQCKNITLLGLTTGPSLNRTKRQPIRSDHDENNYRWPQMFNGQYIKMSDKAASTICGLVSMGFRQ